MHLAVETSVPRRDRRTVTAGLPDRDAAHLSRAGVSISAACCTIKLAATEALAMFRGAARPRTCQQSCPDIRIELRRATHSGNARHQVADAASSLSRVTTPDVELMRLGRMRMLFAARPRVMPTADATKVTSDGPSHRASRHHLQAAARAARLGVTNGAGIEPPLSFAPMFGRKIIPFWGDLHRSCGIRQSDRATSGRNPRMRYVINWLLNTFNPTKYSWFGDEFIHPRELKAVYMGPPLTQIFRGYPTEGQ